MWKDIFYYIILFVIAIAGGIECYKQKKESLLTRDDTSYLKGMAAIMVVMAHYCLRLEEENRLSLVLMPFRFLGPLGVAVFFFVSGYGLFLSNGIQKVKEGFLKKRILNVMVPYFLTRTILLIFHTSLDIKVDSVIDVIRYIIGITVSPSWFVVVIMLLYILYYLCSKLKISENKKIVALCISVLVLSVIFYKIYGVKQYYWYVNNLEFCLGVIVARYDKKITDFIGNRTILLFICSFILFIISCLMYFVLKREMLIIDIFFSGLFFVLLLVSLFQRIKFKGKCMTFIGKYSLYIYITHTKLYRIIGAYFDISNIFFTIIYFILVIVVPVVLKCLYDFILKHTFSRKAKIKKNRYFS